MINNKRIEKFLSKCDPHDIRYLELCLGFARQARELIEEFGLTQIQFCQYMEIPYEAYDSFVGGYYKYDVHGMANIHSAWHKEKKKRAEIEFDKRFPHITKEEYKYSQKSGQNIDEPING